MNRAILSLVLAGLVALAFGLGVMPDARVEADGAAYNLRVSNVTANQASFRWRPSGSGYQQWVDLSHWNGFYWQWEHGGPLSANDRDYTRSGLLTNTTYYVRINTGYWNGAWIASDWVRFETRGVINCGAPGIYQPYQQPGIAIAPCDCGVPGIYQQYQQPGIAIAPCGGTSTVRIWTDRGEGSSYFVGQGMRVCYSVSRPMQIQIIDVLANGVQQTLRQGYDDGRGECFQATVTEPRGLERLTIHGNGASSSTSFYVR